jgi:hypothetical protein
METLLICFDFPLADETRDEVKNGMHAGNPRPSIEGRPARFQSGSEAPFLWVGVRSSFSVFPKS